MKTRYRSDIARWVGKQRVMQRMAESLVNGKCWKCHASAEPMRVVRAKALDMAGVTCCACAGAENSREAKNRRKAVIAGTLAPSGVKRCLICRGLGHNAASCHNATLEQACAWHGVDPAMLHVQHS